MASWQHLYIDSPGRLFQIFAATLKQKTKTTFASIDVLLHKHTLTICQLIYLLVLNALALHRNKASAAKIVTKAVAESPLRHAVKRMESRFCSAVTKRIATEKGARTVPEQESRKKQAQKWFVGLLSTNDRVVAMKWWQLYQFDKSSNKTHHTLAEQAKV